jgi:alkylation response protein AidB-like acyl-CoA dehydrogenase
MENGQPRMTPHGPEMVHVCMPVAEVTVHDTWFVSGLTGTGSHDISASDVFVPDARIFALLDPTHHRTDPLYQMPPVGLFVLQLAAVGLGIARRALDDLMEMAQKKMPTFYTTVLADRGVVQVDLARAEAALGAAHAYLYGVVDELWQAVSAGAAPTARQLASGRLACTHAIETSGSVTRTAAKLAGGSAIYQSSPMQRHVRDAEAIAHHFTVAPHTWEESGRVLLGRPTIAPVF